MCPQDTVEEVAAASAEQSAEAAAQAAAIVTAEANASAAQAAREAEQAISDAEQRVEELAEETEQDLQWLRERLSTLERDQAATLTELRQMQTAIAGLPEVMQAEFLKMLAQLTPQQQQAQPEPEAQAPAIPENSANVADRPEARTGISKRKPYRLI